MGRKSISELVDAMHGSHPELHGDAEAFIQAFFNTIRTALLREHFVKIRGLGTFKLVDVSPRESINVNTGERIEIAGHNKITFTPDAAMRDAVNRPFAHLQAFTINEGTELEEMARIDDAEEVENVTLEEQSVKISADTSDTENAADGSCVNVGDNKESHEAVDSQGSFSDNTDNPNNAHPTQPFDDDSNKDISEKRCVAKVILWCIAGVVLLCAGYVLGYYRVLPLSLPIAKSDNINPTASTSSPTLSAITEVADVSDTVAAKKLARQKDSSNVAPMKNDKATPILPPQQGDEYIITGIKGTYVLKRGEGIIRLAYREYGDKELAKYIIRLNGFSNPDNIAVGTVVKLPELVRRQP